MARPKPPEDSEAILIRLPQSTAQRLRELAAESRTAKGQAMSANQFCAAILLEAVESGIVVRERLRYDMTPINPGLRVAEPGDQPAKNGDSKKRTGT